MSVTITRGAANAVSAITGHAALGGWQEIPTDPRFRITGGPPTLQAAGSSFPANLEFESRGGVTATLALLQYNVEFGFYGDKLEISVLAAGATPIFYADGLPQSVAALPNDGAQYNLLFDFGSVGFHSLRMHCPGGFRWMGIYRAATHSLMPPRARKGPRMIVCGDSWTNGTGTSDGGISGWARLMGEQLGIRDTWSQGIGGTGYIWPSSQGPILSDRLDADVIANNPDVVVIALGSNDFGHDTATNIATAAAADWARIKAGLPKAKLFVLGPWACPAGGGSPGYANYKPIDDALAAAWAAAGYPADHYISSIAEQWITGTGYAGAPNGSGNSDLFISSDSVHPGPAGHVFVGRRAADHLGAVLWT